jgi:hypothetical protein
MLTLIDLRLSWNVAANTVKDRRNFRLNNLEALRGDIDPHDPAIFVFCRKLGFAGRSATWASDDFNPPIADHRVFRFSLPRYALTDEVALPELSSYEKYP